MLSQPSDPPDSGTEAPRKDLAIPGPTVRSLIWSLGPVSVSGGRGQAAAVQAVVELFDTESCARRPTWCAAVPGCRRVAVPVLPHPRRAVPAAFDEQISRATAWRMDDLSDLSTSERIERFVAGRIDGVYG